MIYGIHWMTLKMTQTVAAYWPGVDNLGIGKVLNEKDKILAEFIKESVDDTFMFILVKNMSQWPSFDEWVEKYGLKEYIQVETKGITNPVHGEVKYNLKLVVMQSKDHFQRKETKIEA